MKRIESFASPSWDDPFWHAARMLVDIHKRKIPTEAEIFSPQEMFGSTTGLDAYLQGRQELIQPLREYLQLRADLAADLLDRMRTEDEAKADFRELSDREVRTYGTKMAGYHQSSKVLVATVEIITKEICARHRKTANVDPQQRATVVTESHLWVSPRRLDGAFPALTNPVALWEIKEYWGKTQGGSKMSDAIYECQLVGTELRAFEDKYGVRVEHFVILDGREQWSFRQADLRRAVDLLYCGLIDELIVGADVLTVWPIVMERLCTESVSY